MSLHAEECAVIKAPAIRLFDLLHDSTRLTAHMSKRSWRMGWSRLETALDEGRGRAVGSHIRFCAFSG